MVVDKTQSCNSAFMDGITPAAYQSLRMKTIDNRGDGGEGWGWRFNGNGDDSDDTSPFDKKKEDTAMKPQLTA